MNKFPLITILTFLLVVIGVNADPSFSFADDFVNITSDAAQTASGSFTINNTGTTNLNINFTGYTLTLGSDKLNITSLSNITGMANGTTQSPSFSVVIPAQQTPGLYTGTLTATSNASTTDTITVNLNVTPTYSVSTTSASGMELGSTNLNQTHTKTFNITNTGNANITNVSFDFSVDGFNLQSNYTNFVLEFDKTESIEFNITIPESASTGNVTLGSVQIGSTELDQSLFSVTAEVGGGLIIEDLDIFLTTRDSDNEADLDVVDNKKLNFNDQDIGPESELRFNVNVENTFTDEEDIDIDDISVKVTILEIDDGEDIEEESNEFSLDSDGNEDVNVIVKIPLSVDEGVYEVLIEVEGQDDNNNDHTAEMKVKIDVDKDVRDVIVKTASSFPQTVKCTGSSTLTATLKNIGQRIESDIKLEILNEALGINSVTSNIELDEDPFASDNEFTRKIQANINENTAAGTYPIEVKSYLQEGALWETKTADLIVEACSGAEQQEEGQGEEEQQETVDTETISDTVTGEETSETEEIPVLGPTTTSEVPLTKKPGFWVALIILNIVIIGSVAFFAVKVVGKK
tara:strand:+ start:8136 stop:9863 length:1728 start_codon:yes stop_codon:yes gene_type:complete